jgi:hypothetical protein
MTNVKGNYKGGRSKELVKYTVTGAAKGRAKQAVASGKKFLKDIGSKTTPQQRFLGKTIPKTLFKVAKFAFKNPITATAAFLAPAAIKPFTKKKIASRPKQKQYTNKGQWVL